MVLEKTSTEYADSSLFRSADTTPSEGASPVTVKNVLSSATIPTLVGTSVRLVHLAAGTTTSSTLPSG